MTPGPRRSGDEPVPIRESLAEVGAELGLPTPDLLTTIRGRWDEVVGADMAPHASAHTIRDGALTIVVDDPIWATQLRYLAGDLLDRLDAIAGPGEVTRVRVRVGPGTGREQG